MISNKYTKSKISKKHLTRIIIMKSMYDGMKYYGDTAIGEKGQVVIPAELRKKFGIETGDRFLVLAGEKMGKWGLILLKAEMLARVFNEFFGGRLDEVLAQNSDAKERASTTPSHE